MVEDPNENILIVNTQEPSRTGPRLVHDQTKAWRIDTSLRLLGSGRSLKSKLKTSRLAKAQRLLELEQQLKASKERETTAKTQLLSLYEQLPPVTEHASLQPYLQKVDELIGLYENALKHLQAWREAGATTGYAQELFRLTTEYHKHLNLWISLEQVRYAGLVTVIKHGLSNELDSRQVLLDNISKMAGLGNELITRRELLDSSLTVLPALGATGIIIAARLKALSPLFTVWDIKRNELATTYIPCLREQAAVNMEEARVTVGILVNRAVKVSKDISLMMQSATPALPVERAEQLLNIVDEYASVNQRIDELPVDFPELVEPAPLQRLKALVGEFHQWAQAELDSLLPQVDKTLSGAKKPAIAGSSGSYQKANISKTRPRDLPIKPSEFPAQQPLQLITPRIPRATIPTKDYRQAVSVAQVLALDISPFIERTQQDALRPKRMPADMQDIFDQQAVRLELAAAIIDRLGDEAQKKGQRLPVETLPEELREGASHMRREGIATRAKMLKARKPRQADLQWLLDHAQVRLVCISTDRIKTQRYQDYFQEYQILDATHRDQPLWLAHFHYPTLTTAASHFTVAHLKIAEEHLQQLPSEVSQALSIRTPWDNQLRKISDPLLQAAFLKLKPFPTLNPIAPPPGSDLPSAGND